jgi:hypothetical protein
MTTQVGSVLGVKAPSEQSPAPLKLRSIQILRSYLAPFPEGAALTEVFGWMCLVPLGRLQAPKRVPLVFIVLGSLGSLQETNTIGYYAA